ncbi:uncharacterized protein LOC114286994 isoform X1 [Camellia sinensis]|uniref:uncharacterized protein LOC114286994 isoform X1 n=1 Tax=Camellia sinensis TaxID=4442 RepID=UPI001035D9D5|nr:uncharacterized protein LOC114286994 isoform X1 [Camellia sinensis]
MVCMLSSATKSATVTERRSRDQVYVAAVPLRAAKGPAHLIMSSAYSLNLWDLQHFMVLIKPPSSSSPPLSQAFVFDFQPQDPENIYVALAALSGRKIPGVILTRKLTKPPARKCWFVGYSRVDAIDATYKFNGNWDTGLRIGHHDCRNYTNELVEYLTGEKYVLEHLRRKQDSWSHWRPATTIDWGSWATTEHQLLVLRSPMTKEMSF